ncbi:MAG: hypothetical protein NZM12_08300 [Steroidobacteraceae bacterium]|nr:hypothetical protein [Steroidobacteraceae bacterium]MDW8260573.1 hypothetical protein [Gammaproteobacteria bacterium]
MAAKVEILKKITVANCNAQPTAEEIAKMEKNGSVLPLMDVYGIARKFKPGESDKGPYVKFYGDFKAVNLRSKEVFQSSVLIAPQIVEQPLFAVMSEEGVNNVQFAFRISAKYDKSAATKYVYRAESLLPPADNDPLVLLEKSLAGKLALPAPK